MKWAQVLRKERKKPSDYGREEGSRKALEQAKYVWTETLRDEWEMYAFKDRTLLVSFRHLGKPAGELLVGGNPCPERLLSACSVQVLS